LKDVFSNSRGADGLSRACRLRRSGRRGADLFLVFAGDKLMKSVVAEVSAVRPVPISEKLQGVSVWLCRRKPRETDGERLKKTDAEGGASCDDADDGHAPGIALAKQATEKWVRDNRKVCIDASDMATTLAKATGSKGPPAAGALTDSMEAGEFWTSLREGTMLDGLLDVFTHPRYSLNGSMSEEKLQWFLTEVQQDDRRVVDGARKIYQQMFTCPAFVCGVFGAAYDYDDPQDADTKALARLAAPAVKPGLSILGFAALMTSDWNCIMEPTRRNVHQDMTKPLSSYWICSYEVSAGIMGLRAALNRGCRCIRMVCETSSGWPQLAGTKDRLEDALRIIKTDGFCRSAYPVVVIVQNVDDAALMQLVEMLGTAALNLQSSGVLPSPEAAKEKILVASQSSSSGAPFRCVAYEKGSLSRARKVLDVLSFSECEFQNCRRENRGGEIVRALSFGLAMVHPVAQPNFNPCLSWAFGAQLVPMYWPEGPTVGDLSCLMQMGMFLDNGGDRSGFVLKPPHLVSGDCDPEWLADPVDISVKVIGARGLQEALGAEENQAFVAVHLWGTNEDTSVFETSVSRVRAPLWGTHASFKVVHPEVAILAFQAMQYGLVRSAVVGRYALRMTAVRRGVRWVPLWDALGDTIPGAGILVQLEFPDWAERTAKLSAASAVGRQNALESSARDADCRMPLVEEMRL